MNPHLLPPLGPHLWQGEWIDDAKLTERLASFSETLPSALGQTLDIENVLLAASAYSRALQEKSGNYEELLACLAHSNSGAPEVGKAGEAAQAIAEMAQFLDREALELKLRRELGSLRPFLPVRTQYSDSIFEAWAPLGLLVHVAPSNAASVAPLSVIEGLLSGNLNFLKTSGSESHLPMLFLDGFLKCDASGSLKNFVIAAQIPSHKREWLKLVFDEADAISAWGGEEAMAQIRSMAPAGARVLEWGHKISFVYATAAGLRDPAVLEKIAQECFWMEQQSCSSPQCVYLEGASKEEIEDWATRLANAFKKVAPRARLAPSLAESGEITMTTELAREEACLGLGQVIESPARDWRILVDTRPQLAASPLYASVWLKPITRLEILPVLRPMRGYLQSVGLACALSEIEDIASRLTRAGALRIRRIGEMTESYAGEPHDGVYALQRYTKRMSFQLGTEAKGISSFSELRCEAAPFGAKKPGIMTKSDFQEAPVESRFAHLYFKSGGSTGEPKLSVFTYDDYDEQMRIGAEGLYAAGLEPLLDRNMNLFFSGSLYGGFLSIFSVLERMRAVQFPMAAQMDFKLVADAIIKNHVNSLLGMPSYIIQLFEKEGEALARYGKIDKIFYGGEHFNDAQRRHLREKFGVKLIKSVGYGSVDTGPLGFQCMHCEGGEHHLYQKLQSLEIVELETDRPIKTDAIGRLLFTSKMRKGQKLERYDLGDVGHWVSAPCPCGRLSPRFRLLGRSGDVFRIGSIFLNYQKFAQILAETLDYSGVLQIRLATDGLGEKITLALSSEAGVEPGVARKTLLENYDDLNEVVVQEKILKFEIQAVAQDRFERNPGSGKLIRILDGRKH